MTDRVVFCLNTSAYNFAQWLETHTSVQEFPTERGRFVLQRARAGGNLYKPDGITVDSAYITPNRDDEQMEICHYAGVEVIRFGLTDIGTERDSRVEIDALCSNSFLPVRAYFHALLADIARTWPEAAQPIGELALAFAKEMGVDTSQLAGRAGELEIPIRPAEPAPSEGQLGEGTGWETQAEKRPPYGVFHEEEPRVPVKPAVLNQWKAIWALIKSQWGQGRSYQMISEWLVSAQAARNPQLCRSPDVVKDIIRAGQAGKLND